MNLYKFEFQVNIWTIYYFNADHKKLRFHVSRIENERFRLSNAVEVKTAINK